jgi:hypothetical protein
MSCDPGMAGQGQRCWGVLLRGVWVRQLAQGTLGNFLKAITLYGRLQEMP